MPRRSWLILIAIVLVAFLLRLSIAIEYQGLSSPPDAGANPDQVDYEALGWRLASGAGFTRASGAATAFRPPGTPALIAAVYLACGHSFAAVRVVFCLLSALTCLAVFLLGARLFGERIGLVAAALLALLPNHAYYAQHMLSEAPFALAIVLAALALAHARHATAGLLFGFAFLTRPQSALCVPLLGLVAWLGAEGERRAELKRFARTAACFLLVVLPWVARNRIELGSWAPTTLSGHVFWGAHNPVAAGDPERVGSWLPVEALVDAQHPLPEGEAAATRAAWGYGLDFLREHPGEIPRLLFWKLVRQYSPFQWTTNRPVYWTFALAWLVVGPLAVFGAWLAWRRSRPGALLLLVPPASTLVTGLLFYGAGRFRDADAGLYVLLAAFGLCALLSRAQSSSAPPSAR